MNSVEGYAPVYGGTIPATIWHNFMAEATKHMPVRDFVHPTFAGYNGGPAPASTATQAPPTTSTPPSPKPTHSHEPRPSPTESTSPTPSPTKSPHP